MLSPPPVALYYVQEVATNEMLPGSSKQLARILQVGGQLSGADGRRIAGGGSRNEAERVSTGVKRPALEGKLGLVFEPHPPTPSPVAERGSKIAPEACYPSLNSLGQFSEETPGGEVSSPSPSRVDRVDAEERGMPP